MACRCPSVFFFLVVVVPVMKKDKGYKDQNCTDREFTVLECEGHGFVKATQFGSYFLADDFSTVFFNCS